MVMAQFSVRIPADLQAVWNAVVTVEGYAAWRSDLSRAERVSDSRFVEYTRRGFPTSFTVTAVEPHRRWEFDLENANMTGHWIGIFQSGEGETYLHLTERVQVKRPVPEPLVKLFLARQQRRFAADLKKALKRMKCGQSV